MNTPGQGDGTPQDSGPEHTPQPGWQPPQPDVPGDRQPPFAGSVQRQEPGVTQPRPPTVAEARARDKARRQAADKARAEAAAAAAKRRTRNRVLIGGVAIVGVAGLVGGGYLAYRALTAPDVTAYCVKTENGEEVVVEDRYCTPGQSGFVDGNGSGTGSLIILGGGPQYRYYYGGNNTVGKPPVGGTTIKPKSANITTKSGTTIQRGGLGSKSTGGGGS
ncbi:hypothetical protein [Nocardia higoensis]|uniref:hypothetical protein n=1 Tax=Nocardia higoensis TaxID=228599 RepID=UPI0002E7DD0D|nr:hypothetical protein [Nocardia higoensis]